MDGVIMSNRVLGFVNAPALMQRVVSIMEDRTADLSRYAARRDALTGILREAGIRFADPEGTFYLFCRVPEGGPSGSEDSRELAFYERMKASNILAVPGVGFSFYGWFRLSYCVPESTIGNSAAAWKKTVREWRG